MKKERYMLINFFQGTYTCDLTEQKWHITYTRTFTGGKARTCWKTKFFGPRYLIQGILVQGVWSKVFWSKVIGPSYLVQGIDPMYWVQDIDPRYWVQGIEKGLRVYKEEKIIKPRCERSEILRNTSIWSIYYVVGLCLGPDLKYSCAPWVQH